MQVLEMRTVTITSKGQIAIPKEIRKIKAFKEGSKVIVVAFRDRIELRPIVHFSERMFPALMSEKALAKDWFSKEDEEAWKDL